jgi:hypothetical protein
MSEETRIAPANYDWLVKNRESTLIWELDMFTLPNGGMTIDSLCEPGLTPATR